jgi:hypothetical protein
MKASKSQSWWPSSIFTKNYFKKYSAIVFAVLFVLMSFFYRFDDILFLRPQSVHQWRQCDCLSFTLNYYHEDIGFFSPQLHNLAEDGTGRAVSDCPLIYYSVGKLWKVFGYHEFIYRLVVLLFCFVGLLALMKLVEDLLNDSVIALFISLLMFASTLLVYYANNFLMNVPSFSMALVGIFFFYRFYKTDKDRFLYFSMLCYTVAGLLKIPGLTSFLAIGGLYFLELLGILKLKKDEKLFKRPLQQLIPFAIVLVTIFAWYNFAYSYNEQYNQGIFQMGTLPIWDLTSERITHIFKNIWLMWFDSYHSPFTQYLAVLLLLVIFIFNKRVKRILLLLTSFLFVGFVAFVSLWFDAFDQHDYFLINQLGFMVAIFVTFFHFLKANYPKIFMSKWLRVALIVLLVSNAFYCRDNVNFRFVKRNDRHQINTLALENITPYLDSIGVSVNKKVLFISDGSFNIPLYLMDRRGYTAKKTSSDESILWKIKKVDYLIVNDSSYAELPVIKNQLNKRIGVFENVSIYSLKQN